MLTIDWPNFIPALTSAIASIAAAYAAFVALRISKRANTISEKSILAEHHQGVAEELSKVIDNLDEQAVSLSEIASDLWIDWSREIEKYDFRTAGGNNPRPLRHVLSNGCVMLAEHASIRFAHYERASRSMFSIISLGISPPSEKEYNRLLAQADNKYSDFESTFGIPTKSKSIIEASAFKWVYYQLIMRVQPKDWEVIWQDAWSTEGKITQFRTQFSKVHSILLDSIKSLDAERRKIDFGVFPLEANHKLNKKYTKVMSGLHFLVEAGSFENIEGHCDWPYSEDIPLLVLYTLGVAYLAEHVLQTIHNAGDN